jgi:hypothetical protein
MKKASPKALLRQEIGRKRTAAARLRRREYVLRKANGGRIRPRRGVLEQRRNREVIAVPEVLDMAANRRQTMEIALACRENCFIKRRETLLDFGQTRKISSAAILYLVAEIDRCRRFQGSPMLTGTYPKDSNLHRQMRDSGFFDALRVKSRLEGEERRYPMEYIKVVSGHEADGLLARELRTKLLGPLDEKLAQSAKSSFFRSLSEAMTNVSQHAYPEDWPAHKVKVVHKGWWMLGHINKLRRELKVMIVDQGIGIPRSLPRKYTMEVIAHVLSLLGFVSPTDSEMIRAAMEVGRSRMGQDNRGKGLNDLKKLIQACGTGRMRILSNRGEYVYSESAHDGASERLITHEDSINGTFIEWTVPLNAILPFLEEQTHESH